MAHSAVLRPATSFARPRFFLFASIAVLALLSFDAWRANATIHFVTTTGTGNGSSWAMAGPLQATIAASVSGDQVWVKHGTYTETNNFTAADGVAVYGHFAGTETSVRARQLTNTAYTTILNASKGSTGPVYSIPSASVHTNTLDGFTIENPVSNQSNTGLEDSSPNGSLKVVDCTFTATAGRSSISVGLATSSKSTTTTNCVFSNIVGGAISASGTTTTITGCTFDGNGNSSDGGAISALGKTATVSGCTFTGNSAGVGGAVYAAGTTTVIKGCTFTSNSGDAGGAVYAGSTTTGISGCTFTRNTAVAGGGVFALSSTTIADCTFGSSSTSDANSPQAISLDDVGNTSTSPATPAVIKDNLILGVGTATTDADGIDIDTNNSSDTSYATIANNTIVNTNVGIDIATMSGEISVANNIFYGDHSSLNDTGSATFTSSHNDVYGNVTSGYQGVSLSASDLTVNPQFVDSGQGNYHLASNSPLINAGNDGFVMTGDTDLDGHARIQGSHVDIGAYEATLPTVTSFTPTSGPIGTVVTVTGANLNGVTAVRFHNANATTFSANAAGTQIMVTVPSGAATGTFTVMTPNGSIKTTGTFTVN